MMKIKKVKYYITGIDSYSESGQTSPLECFAKIVNSQKPLTFFAKHSILDVWQVSIILNCHQKLLAFVKEFTFGFPLKILRIYKCIMNYIKPKKYQLIFSRHIIGLQIPKKPLKTLWYFPHQKFSYEFWVFWSVYIFSFSSYIKAVELLLHWWYKKPANIIRSI